MRRNAIVRRMRQRAVGREGRKNLQSIETD
jgi:hypothetical protein